MSRPNQPIGQANPGHLLTSRSVRIWTAVGVDVKASVEEHGTHIVTRSEYGWKCTCLVSRGCNHIVAVKMVCPKWDELFDAEDRND